jgi:hypothetical protein
MAIKHNFTYVAPEGKPLVNIHQWAAGLTIEEQQEFALANERQLQLREEAIARGDLVVDSSASNEADVNASPVYVWKDAETAERGKEADPKWIAFWERYLAETGIKFEVVDSEV